MNTNYLIETVKKLQLKKPTFVASEKKAIRQCQKLSEIFDSNYAFIEKKSDQFGSSVVVCGRVNPDVIFITPNRRAVSFYQEDIELIWCAGANNIFIENAKREFKKLPNPFYHPKTHYI